MVYGHQDICHDKIEEHRITKAEPNTKLNYETFKAKTKK